MALWKASEDIMTDPPGAQSHTARAMSNGRPVDTSQEGIQALPALIRLLSLCAIGGLSSTDDQRKIEHILKLTKITKLT